MTAKVTKRKVKGAKRGPKPVVTEEKLRKLEEVFALDGTVEEALYYADLAESSYYDYLKEHPETAEHFKRLRNRPVLAARQTVNRAIRKDSDIAFRYLERKRRKEFGPHQVIEGDGIRPILVMHEGDVRLQSVAKKRSIKI